MAPTRLRFIWLNLPTLLGLLVASLFWVGQGVAGETLKLRLDDVPELSFAYDPTAGVFDLARGVLQACGQGAYGFIPEAYQFLSSTVKYEALYPPDSDISKRIAKMDQASQDLYRNSISVANCLAAQALAFKSLHMKFHFGIFFGFEASKSFTEDIIAQVYKMAIEVRNYLEFTKKYEVPRNSKDFIGFIFRIGPQDPLRLYTASNDRELKFSADKFSKADLEVLGAHIIEKEMKSTERIPFMQRVAARLFADYYNKIAFSTDENELKFEPWFKPSLQAAELTLVREADPNKFALGEGGADLFLKIGTSLLFGNEKIGLRTWVVLDHNYGGNNGKKYLAENRVGWARFSFVSDDWNLNFGEYSHILYPSFDNYFNTRPLGVYWPYRLMSFPGGFNSGVLNILRYRGDEYLTFQGIPCVLLDSHKIDASKNKISRYECIGKGSSRVKFRRIKTDDDRVER